MMKSSVADFSANGFCVVKNLLCSDSRRVITNDIHRLVRLAVGPKASTVDHLDDLWGVLEDNDPKRKSLLYDSLGSLASLLKLFLKEEITSIINEIGGENLFLTNPQIRADRGCSRFLNLHQELGQLSYLTFTVWAPLIGSAKLLVAPGSHRAGLAPHVEYAKPFPHWGVKKLDIETSVIEVEAGDFLIFHPLLIHGSPLEIPAKNIRWIGIARYSDFDSAAPLLLNESKFPIKRTDLAYREHFDKVRFSDV